MDRYDHYTDKLIKAQPHTYRGVTLNDVLMYFDSLEGNEDAWTEFCCCLECRGWGLYHIQSATDKNVGTNDTISRQEAIDALRTCYDTETVTMDNGDEYINYGDAVGEIEQLPPAQPEQNLDEWCTACKEYDHENSCCPRWTKVIRQTRRELQDEFVMTAVDGTLWVTVDDVQKVSRVIVDEGKSKFCKTFYQDAQPAFGEIKHAGLGHPLADSEIIPRLREIQSLIHGGSYAIDRAIELIQAQPGFTTMTVGRTKGETTMWYECDACGEPVDQGDTFCSGCGRRLINE